MKRIDAHAHVFPQYAKLAVRVMDKAGIDSTITHEWHDGFGKILKEHLKIFNRFKGRFKVFGNIDMSKVNKPDFSKQAVEELERDVEPGIAGLKVYKSLGLELKDKDGRFIRIDDERFDPIWHKAGELGIPVLIHTADPSFFWQPINEENFWEEVLQGEYAWWSYYRKGFPSREELLSERNNILRKHPDTIFIGPHMGSSADNLDYIAQVLERYPNFYVDISARVPILGLSGVRHNRASHFFNKYSDRILFGTDLIYDDEHIATRIQAQTFLTKEDVDISGLSNIESYINTSVDFIKSHIKFIETSETQTNPPFKRIKNSYSIKGLGLSKEIKEKIYYKNIEKILAAKVN